MQIEIIKCKNDFQFHKFELNIIILEYIFTNVIFNLTFVKREFNYSKKFLSVPNVKFSLIDKK